MKVSIPKQELEISPEDMEAVQSFIYSVVPNFIKEFGGMVNDAVKGYRARNAISIMMGLKKKVEASGLSQRELSGKFFIQALEKGSSEDDAGLQERWSTLLANAVSGKIDQDIKYISILSELNSQEVLSLDSLYIELLKNPSQDELIFSTKKLSENLRIELSKAKVMIDNFYRLNICRPPAASGMKFGEYNTAVQTNLVFVFTDLGINFLEAVKN